MLSDTRLALLTERAREQRDAVEVLSYSARRAFGDVLRACRDLPELRSVEWWVDDYRQGLRFEARFVGAPPCGWFVDPRQHSLGLLMGLLARDGPEALRLLWQQMVAAERHTRTMNMHGPPPRYAEAPEIRDMLRPRERLMEMHAPAEVIERIERDLRRAMVAHAEREIAPVHIGIDYAAEGPGLTAGAMVEMQQRLYHTARLPPHLIDGYAEAARAYDAATKRGEALLKSWLTAEQLASYERRGDFEVRGGATGRRYRIQRASSFNVALLNAAGNVAGQLCFMPEGRLVNGDIMLAQKLALETNEHAALQVANVSPGSPEGVFEFCALLEQASRNRRSARIPAGVGDYRGVNIVADERLPEGTFVVDSRRWTGLP